MSTIKANRYENTATTAGGIDINGSGLVGIGTSSFTASSSGRQILEINGTSSSLINLDVGGTRKAYQFTDGTDVYSYNTANGSYIFGTNDIERGRFDSSGRLLVNCSSSPSNKNTVTPTVVVDGSGVNGALQINRHTSPGGGGSQLLLSGTRGGSVTSYTVVQNGDGLGTIDFMGADGGEFVTAAQIQGQVDGTPGDNDMPGRLVFSTSADGASSPTERMRLDSSGRLGIGESSPSMRLDVKGTVSAGSGSDEDLQQWNIGSNNVKAEIKYVDASASRGMRFGTSTDHVLAFQTNNTERARFDSSGRLLVGATAAVAGSDANGLLQVSQNVASNTCIMVAENTASSGNLSCIRARFRNYSPNNIFNAFLQCDDSTASRFVLRSNGGLANYSANNANLSDRNAKKDISAAADTWNCIKEWEIVNYRYKDQPDDVDLNLGVIAQQVAESCPEVITIFQEAKEATETEPAQEERLGVKEQQMHWMAIKALQEAMTRIETLEQRLSDAGIA